MTHGLKRSLRAVLVALFALLMSGLLVAPGHAAPPVITPAAVYDEVGTLNKDQVVKDISSLGVPEGTTVTLLFSDHRTLDPNNFDATVRAHFLQVASREYLTPEGRGLGDKVVLVAISPTLRKLGIYGGSQTQMTPSLVSQVTSSMKSQAQAKRWEGAFTTAVSTYGSVLANAKQRPQVPAAGAPAPASAPTVDTAAVGAAFQKGMLYLGAALGVIIVASLGYLGIKVLVDRRTAAEEKRKQEEAAAKERAAALAWEGPSKAAVEEALSAWTFLKQRFLQAGLTPPKTLTAAVTFLTALSSTLPITEEQKLDKTFVKEAKAYTDLERGAITEVTAAADYALGQGTWERTWRKKVTSYTASVTQAREGVTKAGEHLSRSDLQEVRALVAAAEAAGEEVDSLVRKGKLLPPAGEETLNKHLTSLQEDLGTFAQRVTPVSAPQGKVYRYADGGGTVNNYTTTNSGMDLYQMLWMNEVLTHSHHHDSSGGGGRSSYSSSSSDSSSSWSSSSSSSSFSSFDSGSSGSSFSGGSDGF